MNKVFCIFLSLLFLFSCTPLSGPEDNFKAEETSMEDMKVAINLITNALSRTQSDADLLSFVADGETKAKDENGVMQKESSVYIEFDGQNKFYRKDVYYYMAEEPIESQSWCEYKENAENKWLITTTDEGAVPTPTSEPESIASILSFLQLEDSEINTLKADENFIYKLQKGNDTIELGFSSSRLGYCSIYHVADESDSYDVDYIHKFYLKGYGSPISINIPKR